MKKNKLSFLLSPWVILAGMASGVFIGLQHKELALRLAPAGEIYLALLQMCIIPIMITAVLSSLGRLLMSGKATAQVGRLLLIFVIGLFTASALGLTVGLIAKPGAGLNKSAQETMGRKISETEIVFTGTAQTKKEEVKSSALLLFAKEAVTTNVISAISRGKNLPVLLFFILLGVAIGLVRSPGCETFMEITNALYHALLKIITWVMYGLPFGLCCLLSSQIASIGMDIMFALLKLIVSCYICALVLVCLYGVTMWLKLKGSFFRSFAALKDSFVVALGTSSSFAAIPATLQGLDNLHLDEQNTKLVIPLGMNLNPHGAVMHFAISAVFIAQLYGTPLNISSLIIILIGSVLAGLAATGVPGAGGLGMIALILGPLGLPAATAIILLASIDPILDPIVTLTTVHANCASSAMIAEEKGEI